MAVQEGVVGDGIKHKHLALLCAQPHGVINTTDASDASTAHRKELRVCVCVCVCVEREVHTPLYKNTIQHCEPLPSPFPPPPSHATSVEKLAFPLKLMTHT